MSENRRSFLRRMALFGGLPAAVLGAGAWALNRKVNPHTPLHYAFPPEGGRALPATPECAELEPTESVTEGPFYTPNTPRRVMLRDANTAGTPLTLQGRVLTQDCMPISGAVVDVWNCDGNGVYDNKTFNLRGHQFTDENGGFSFETVKPRDYRDFGIHRTAHIHVKVQGRGTRLLTTQLFFPGEAFNADDFFFREALLVDLHTAPAGGLAARFDFVLQT